MKPRKQALVNTSVCVSCGACHEVCPTAAISTPNGCYACVDVEHCIGCGKCSRICPTGCISLIEREVIAS